MPTLKQAKSKFSGLDSVGNDLIATVDGVQVSVGSVFGDEVTLTPEGQRLWDTPAAKRTAAAPQERNPSSSILTEVTAQSGETTSRGEGAQPLGEPPGELLVQTGEPITKTPEGQSKVEASVLRGGKGKKAQTATQDDDDIAKILAGEE